MQKIIRVIIPFVLIFLSYFDIAKAAAGKDIVLKSVSIEALGNIADESSVDILGEYLNNEEFLLQSSAIYSLYKIKSPKAVSLLKDKVSSQNIRIAVQAAAASSENSNSLSNTVFEGAFRDNDKSIRLEAIDAAMKMSKVEAIPQIITRLKDNDNSVRIKAVEALTNLGCKSPEALDIIEKMLYEPDPRLRAAAALALGKTGYKKYIPAIKNMLSDEDGAVAAYSRIALAQLEGKVQKRKTSIENDTLSHIIDLTLAAEFSDVSAIPQILDDIKNINSSTYLRVTAVSALKDIQDNHKNLLNKIIIKDRKLKTIKDNIGFVFKIDNKSITEFFLEALQDSSSVYHNDAPRVLAAWGDKIAGPALVSALERTDENSDFLVDVIYALGVLGEKSALNKIEQFLVKK